MDDQVLRTTLRVRAVDVDSEARLKPKPLLDCLIEGAAEHAARLGFSVPDMNKRNLTWVLSRWHIRILRYPRMWQEFELETWPSVRDEIYALREFELSDGHGQLAQATTSWLAVDLQSKKPVRLEKHLPDLPQCTRRALDDEFPPLPEITGDPDAMKEFPVLGNDLDFNRHVTSTAYILWALESVPDDVMSERRPSAIEINYRSETFFGDRIISVVQRQREGAQVEFRHRLTSARDGRELAALRTAWE